MGYYSYNGHPRAGVPARRATFKCKNPEATAETIDAQGWQHTGDIGRWNADGTLSIIDRKKNIFKLSQGEYVAAEKIEMAVSKSPLVGQVWVYGNSQETASSASSSRTLTRCARAAASTPTATPRRCAALKRCAS